MCQRLFLFGGVALAAMLLPQTGFAQLVQFPGDYPNESVGVGYGNGGFQGTHYRLPFPYGGLNGGYGSVYPSAGYAPAYAAPVYAAPSVPYQPAYPQVIAVEPTLIHVHVPMRATVYFDGGATKQTGADRYYRTPSLASDRPFTYQVSARWQENGKEHVETRLVRFLPGQTVEVDFAPTTAAGLANR